MVYEIAVIFILCWIIWHEWIDHPIKDDDPTLTS
jgi:hypothetical protein